MDVRLTHWSNLATFNHVISTLRRKRYGNYRAREAFLILNVQAADCAEKLEGDNSGVAALMSAGTVIFNITAIYHGTYSGGFIPMQQ